MSENVKKRKIEEVYAKTAETSIALNLLIKSTTELIALQDVEPRDRQPEGSTNKPDSSFAEAFAAETTCQFCYSPVKTKCFKSCQRGHLLHAVCVQQMEAALGSSETMRCGLCGNVETSFSYNQPMAGIIEAYYTCYATPCENELEGCDYIGKLNDLRRHEQFCPARKIVCGSVFKHGAASDYATSACKMVFPAGKIHLHFRHCSRAKFLINDTITFSNGLDISTLLNLGHQGTNMYSARISVNEIVSDGVNDLAVNLKITSLLETPPGFAVEACFFDGSGVTRRVRVPVNDKETVFRMSRLSPAFVNCQTKKVMCLFSL